MNRSSVFALVPAGLLMAQLAAAQAPAPQGGAPPEVKVVATNLGGNENFAKLGVTILGRSNLRNEQLKPRPAPGNGQVPPALGSSRFRQRTPTAIRR